MSQDSLSAAHDDLPPDRLRRFATSLRELAATRDVDESLQLMVELAVELVRGIDVADVMFVRDGHVSMPVSTDELSVKLDRAQQEAGEGPCLTALRDEEVVVSHDLEAEDRWPQFTTRAVELGVRSVAAYRLFDGRDGDRSFGALNLFGHDSGLDELDVELGGVFAAHCATVLVGVIEEQGLHTALQSRDVIGQAKGILMERHRLTPDQAYAMLRQASMDRNIKVRELARIVTETGAVP